MHLRLKHLTHVVKRARDEERAVEALKLEVKRVLGPIMNTDVVLGTLAEAVNDRVSVMRQTGRTSHLGFKPSTVIPFTSHKNPEVRAMAANLLPERFLDKLKFDPHASVRAAVARRGGMETVREMMRRFPTDDELKSIYRARRQQRLNEDGVAKPKVSDEPFDIYGEERLGDAVKTPEGPELSDDWYRTQAEKLISDYDNGKLERSWTEGAVNNLVRHTKATSGVEIDGEKLLEKIEELYEEYDEYRMERYSLKEMASRLIDSDEELLEESIDDSVDPVYELVESNLSPSQYIERANAVFNIREASIPPGLRKYRLGEHVSTKHMPAKAKLPHDGQLRAVDERALDLYVKHWNNRQALSGEPLKIQWTVHPSQVGVVGFSASWR